MFPPSENKFDKIREPLLQYKSAAVLLPSCACCCVKYIMYPKILLNILYEGIESHKGLRLLVGFTMDQFEFGDAEPVDELLAEADFSRMDPIFSNGILRYTCSKQMYPKGTMETKPKVDKSHRTLTQWSGNIEVYGSV
jgi:hypothetical protein